MNSITNALSGGQQNYNAKSKDYEAWLKEKATLQVDPVGFNDTTKSEITTLTKLGRIVNGIFAPNFHDYEGCTFKLINGVLAVSLFFADKGPAMEGKIKSFCTLTDYLEETNAAKVNRGEAMSRISRFNNRSNAVMFTLNSETREILYDMIPFVLQKAGDRDTFWSQNIVPTVPVNLGMMNPNNGQPVSIEVTGLDLGKILKLKYGKKSEDGAYLEYNVSLIRPISVFGFSQTQNGSLGGDYLIQISQLNQESVRKIYEQIGFTTGNDVVMYKA